MKMNNKIDETQILEADTVNDFLGEYNVKETIRSYKGALKRYFTFINVDPDKYVIDIRLLEKNKKIKVIDQYEKDITNYKNYLLNESYAPRSIHNEISSIKLFLEHHRIDLDKTFWNKLKKRGMGKGTGTITDFKIPSSQDLKKILTHATTRARAMFLLQTSSGMRLGEICALKLSDIDLGYKYPHIIIRYETAKTRVKGRTRCSPEAKTAIKEWLKIRDQSYKTAQNRTSGEYRNPDGKDRLFPISVKMARYTWNGLLEKSGFTERDNSGKEKKNKRHLMATHANRKYFRSEFSKYDNELAKYLMNQRTPLDRVYRDWSDEYLDKEYAKGVGYLLVFEKGEDPEQIEKFEKYKQDQGKKELEMGNKILDLEKEVITVRKQYVQIEGNYRQLNGKMIGVEQKVKTFESYQMQDILMDTDVDAFMHEFYNNPEFKEKIRKILKGIKKKAEEGHKQQMCLKIA